MEFPVRSVSGHALSSAQNCFRLVRSLSCNIVPPRATASASVLIGVCCDVSPVPLVPPAGRDCRGGNKRAQEVGHRCHVGRYERGECSAVRGGDKRGAVDRQRERQERQEEGRQKGEQGDRTSWGICFQCAALSCLRGPLYSKLFPRTARGLPRQA